MPKERIAISRAEYIRQQQIQRIQSLEAEIVELKIVRDFYIKRVVKVVTDSRKEIAKLKKLNANYQEQIKAFIRVKYNPHLDVDRNR